MYLRCTKQVNAGYIVHFLAMYLRCTGSVHHPLPPVITFSTGTTTGSSTISMRVSPTEDEEGLDDESEPGGVWNVSSGTVGSNMSPRVRMIGLPTSSGEARSLPLVFLLGLNELGGQVFVLNTATINTFVESFKVLVNMGDGGLKPLVHFGDVVLGGHKLNLNVGNTRVDFNQTSILVVQQLGKLDVVRGNLEVDINTMSQDTIHDIEPCHRS